jgi:hypothetical protein
MFFKEGGMNKKGGQQCPYDNAEKYKNAWDSSVPGYKRPKHILPQMER